MAISVTNVSTAAGEINSQTVDITITVTAGDSIAVVVACVDTTEDVTGVSGGGLTWNTASTSYGTSPGVGVYWADVSGASAGGKTITVSLSPDSDNMTCFGYSLAGTATTSPVGNTSLSNGTSTAASTTISTGTANSIVITGYAAASNITLSNTTPATNHNFTTLTLGVGGNKCAGAANTYFTTTAGDYSPEAASSKSVNWRTLAVEFLEPAAPSTESVTRTTSARLYEEGTDTHTTDASLVFTESTTRTTDALLYAEEVTTHTTDAGLKATASTTRTTSARLYEEGTDAHTTDALLYGEVTDTHTTDASLKATVSTTRTTDALLYAEEVTTHTTDASIAEGTLTETDAHTTDAYLYVESTDTHTTDAYLYVESTDAHTTDSLLYAEIATTRTTDALLYGEVATTHTTDALLYGEETDSHTTDALLYGEETDTHTTDARLGDTAASAVTTDARLFKSPVYPLSVHADGRHIVDADGTRQYFVGDAAWSIGHNIAISGQGVYLADRQKRGVNSLLVQMMLTEIYYLGSVINFYGEQPFSTLTDWDTVNSAYFAPMYSGLKNALARGMTVFMCPAYVGFPKDDPILNEGWAAHVNEYMQVQTDQKMFDYGVWLANYFSEEEFPNIIWTHGGDAGPDMEGLHTDATSKIRSIQSGILSVDTERLHTAHAKHPDSALDSYTNFNLDFNTTYGIPQWTAEEIRDDWDYVPTAPTIHVEGGYEESPGGYTDVQVRSQMWWSLLGGTFGHIYGHSVVWDYTDGWPDKLEDTGSNALAVYANYVRTDLVPDYGHATLTVGYGDITDDTYAGCALTEGKNRLIVYTPDQRDLTIILSGMVGTAVDCNWINPATGAVTAIGEISTVSGQIFNPPSSGDWVFTADSLQYAQHDTDALLWTPISHTTDAALRHISDLYETSLETLIDPGDNTEHVVSVRTRKANAIDEGTLRVWLMQGSTEIDTFDITLTDSFATTERTVPTASAANITSYSDLRIRLQTFSDDPDGLRTEVSWVELKIPEVPTGTVNRTTSALLYAEEAVTYTTDARLYEESSDSHTTGALLYAEETVTRTTDALLYAEETVTRTTDARIYEEGTDTHTTDARMYEERADTHTTDALIVVAVTTETDSHTTDALLYAEETVTHTTDALLYGEEIVTRTTDARLYEEGTDSHTTDAYLYEESSDSHTTSVRLYGEETDSHTTDAGIWGTTSTTRTTDARISDSNDAQHTTDAGIWGTTSTTRTTDAYLYEESSDSHTTSVRLYGEETDSHTTDAGIWGTTSTTRTTDARISDSNDAQHTTDAGIWGTTSTTRTTDAYLYEESSDSHTTSVRLYGEETDSHTTDAGIWGTTSTTRTTDARISDSNDAQHTTDAGIWGTTSTTRTTDAYLYEESSDSHTTSVRLYGEETDSHTTDARIYAKSSDSHTTDALLYGEEIVTRTTDARLYEEGTDSHTTDAYLYEESSDSHTTDAYLYEESSDSHTTDARVYEEGANSHTTDAYLYEESSDSHTTDALLEVTSITVSHATNASIWNRTTSSHATDAWIYTQIDRAGAEIESIALPYMLATVDEYTTSSVTYEDVPGLSGVLSVPASRQVLFALVGTTIPDTAEVQGYLRMVVDDTYYIPEAITSTIRPAYGEFPLVYHYISGLATGNHEVKAQIKTDSNNFVVSGIDLTAVSLGTSAVEVFSATGFVENDFEATDSWQDRGQVVDFDRGNDLDADALVFGNVSLRSPEDTSVTGMRFGHTFSEDGQRFVNNYDSAIIGNAAEKYAHVGKAGIHYRARYGYATYYRMHGGPDISGLNITQSVIPFWHTDDYRLNGAVSVADFDVVNPAGSEIDALGTVDIYIPDNNTPVMLMGATWYRDDGDGLHTREFRFKDNGTTVATSRLGTRDNWTQEIMGLSRVVTLSSGLHTISATVENVKGDADNWGLDNQILSVVSFAPLKLAPVINFRADRNDGERSSYIGNDGVWALTYPSPRTYLTSGVLNNFPGDVTGGWGGNGLITNPNYLRFDGIDNYIDIDTSTFTGTYFEGNSNYYSRSYALWVRPPETVASGYVLSISDGTDEDSIYIDSSNNISAVIDQAGGAGGIITSITTLSPSTWYHVALVKNDFAETAELYINGVEEDSFSGTVKIADYDLAETLYLGTRYSTENYVNLDVASVEIYNENLTGSQVASIYDKEANWYNGVIEETTTVTTDARLYEEGTDTHTTSALLYAEEVVTRTTDALLYAEETTTVTTDARLYEEGTDTHTTSALLYAEEVVTRTTDALLYAEETTTVTTDARLYEEGTDTHTTSARLEITAVVESTTHATDARIYEEGADTHTTDASIWGTTSTTRTTDARMSDSNELQHSVNAGLKGTDSATRTTDAYLYEGSTATCTTDALLSSEGTTTHTTNASTQATQTTSHSTDANISSIALTIHSTDAVLYETSTDSHTSDALLVNLKSHGTNASLAGKNTTTHTTSAEIRAPGWKDMKPIMVV